MWIRTQDNYEIVRVDAVFAANPDHLDIIAYKPGTIDRTYYLGRYKTEAEALAVLDRIQKAIERMDEVFVMPEQGFLKQ
jgi:hypothetical protein